MKRRLGWALLVAVGMALGAAIGAYEKPLAAAGNAQDAELADELKEIKQEVTAIKTILRTETLKVVVLLNPDNP